jgi:CHAT domain-containing protein
MIEDRLVVLVPVPQLIPDLMKRKARPKLAKELLVMGGVDYDHRASDQATQSVAKTDEPLRPWEMSDTLTMRSVTRGQRLPFLAASEGEAVFIRSTYQNAMGLKDGTDRIALMSGASATEEEFRRLAPQCYMMHLATHGFFAAEDKKSSRSATGEAAGAATRTLDAEVLGFSPGLLSGLVLAGANDPPPIPDDPAKLDQMPDDGFLTADEIAVLPLGGAHLVVLSACESGLGQSAGGEGLLGIQRAFQVAGARTTIASIWKVPDLATRTIMDKFSKNYLDHTNPMTTAKALQAAQVYAIMHPEDFKRGADSTEDAAPLKRLPPQYWAAFSVSGAWQ